MSKDFVQILINERTSDMLKLVLIAFETLYIIITT